MAFKRKRWLAPVILGALVACGPVAARQDIPTPETVEIPAGPYVIGSDGAEREAGYRLDEAAYGHSVTRERRWYESEFKRRKVKGGRYRIARTLVTNRQYQAFVKATGHPAPGVDRETWRGYGLIHPYARTRRHAWKGVDFPEGRGDHPVVLVGYADAVAYAGWLGRVSPHRWRLPSEREWEKAARGADGRRFPWGDRFDADRLNSHDKGPFDTMPVGRFPAGASPYGLLDAAGQVFEWTATGAGKDGADKDRRIVKGGSWDDKGCGICRPAARHSRPIHLKHILIGFRLVREAK